MVPCVFVIKWLCILMSRGPWERGCIKSGINRALCKARQSLPFMITAEVTKLKNQNKTTKSELKHLTYGTHWIWFGTHYFSWGESQGLTNGKMVTKSLHLLSFAVAISLRQSCCRCHFILLLSLFQCDVVCSEFTLWGPYYTVNYQPLMTTSP